MLYMCFKPFLPFWYNCPSYKIFEQVSDEWCASVILSLQNSLSWHHPSFPLEHLSVMQVHFRILVCPHPFILENDTSRSLPPQAKKKKKSNKNHFSYLQKLALVIPRNFTFVFFFLSIYFTQHVVLLFLSSTFVLYVFFFFFFVWEKSWVWVWGKTQPVG
jgi:hypothetical protein